MEKYYNLAITLGVALGIYLLLHFIGMRILRAVAKRTKNKFDDILIEKNVVSQAILLIPGVIVSAALPQVLPSNDFAFEVVSKAISIWFAIVGLRVFSSFLNVVEFYNDRNERTKSRPMKGLFQALKLIAFCVCVVLIISQVSGKSPVFILSALGAAATVLILIFRDSILGVVSGLQINISDLLRKGDWIEIAKHDADGTVIDITLTSVKIRNWDQTVSVIPAYDLITNSFKNWRGMVDSGGRRIKRSLFIDVKSIRFLTDEEVERLSKIEILAPYLKQKVCELGAQNCSEDPLMLNKTHMTNIGTFRAYCNAYLQNNPKIHKKMTLMTRQLQPTAEGLPLEIYAFTNITNWVEYENIQSDIFDHLIAALSKFELKLFQYPSLVTGEWVPVHKQENLG